MKTRHIPGAAMLTAVLSLGAIACGEGPSAPAHQGDRLHIDARLEQARGASGGPSTLQWNAEAITLAGRHLLRAPVANRAYMLLSVAEARSLDALSDASLRTIVVGTTGKIFRRIKHFSGYLIITSEGYVPCDPAEGDPLCEWVEDDGIGGGSNK